VGQRQLASAADGPFGAGSPRSVPHGAGRLDVKTYKLCRVPGRSGGLRTSSVCLLRGARRAFSERGRHSRGSGTDARVATPVPRGACPSLQFSFGKCQTKTKPKKSNFGLRTLTLVVHLHLFAVQRWPSGAGEGGRRSLINRRCVASAGSRLGNRALGGGGGSASARLRRRMALSEQVIRGWWLVYQPFFGC
jgi:hypothetical protein